MNKLTILLSVTAAAMLFSCNKSVQDSPLPICCRKEKASADTTLSGSAASIYQLSGNWTDQNGRQVSLNELKGKVQVVAMIFTHCGYACPHTVDNMKDMESLLPAAVRDKAGFVLISFDAGRDTAQQLKAFAAVKQLDQRWTLLHGTAAQVRELSMLLDLQYEQLPGGNFSHSNVITVLDRQGAIAKRIEGLDPDISDAAAAISRLAAGE